MDNPEWDVVDSKCEYKQHVYFEGAHYPEVIYYLTIERKATVYRYTVYLPVLSALLINLMSLFLDIRNPLRFHLSSLSFVTLLLVIFYLGFKLGFGSLGLPKVGMFSFYQIVYHFPILHFFYSRLFGPNDCIGLGDHAVVRICTELCQVHL